MDPHRPTLPQDVIDAIERGQRIEAIKRLRTAARVDLSTAHDAVAAYEAGRPLPPLPGLSVSPAALSQAAASLLPDDVLDALRSGNKIEAIKRLREATGLGLKEAKDLVEAHEAGGTGSGGRRSSTARTSTVMSGDGGLRIGPLLVLIALAAASAWWFLH